MSKVIVFESLTLDGVMQAPGRADEDPRGGFPHGGWAMPYSDPVLGSLAGEDTTTAPALLLGRRTYQDFSSYWPDQTGNPYAERLNRAQKYVASTTLREPLAWRNSTLLKGDVPEAVARLKARLAADILVFGSGELVRTLMEHNLIDQYILLIYPLVLGSGRRLFDEGATFAPLQLINTQISTTGVIVATYQPAAQDAGQTSTTAAAGNDRE